MTTPNPTQQGILITLQRIATALEKIADGPGHLAPTPTPSTSTNGGTPTQRQIDFIQKLRGEMRLAAGDLPTTKEDASQLIKELLAKQNSTTSTPSTPPRPADPPPPPKEEAKATPEERANALALIAEFNRKMGFTDG